MVMPGVLVWFGVYACGLALVLTRADWWVGVLMWFGFPSISFWCGVV